VAVFRFCAFVMFWLGVMPRVGGAAPDQDLPQGRVTARVFAGTNGLHNLGVSNIVQDRNGFLWLGTDDGVYRFDGESFIRFSTRDGLTSNIVRGLGLAPDGTVCVGADDGLACQDGKRFSQARTRGLPPAVVNVVRSFAGKLWVGTSAGLLVQNDEGIFVRAPGWPGGSTAVRATWADAAGLVVGDGAKVRMTTGDGRWSELDLAGLDREPIEELLRDQHRALWIRAGSHLWWVPPGATAIDLRDGLPPRLDSVGMVLGPRGDVLIATDRGVAYRERGRWRTIALTGAAGLSSATIHAMFVDRESTLWLGAAGLVQVRGRGVIEHYDEASGLPGDTVWSYQHDREGTLWIGTNRCLARSVGQRWECLKGSEGRMVVSILFPPQGGVFIGGAPPGLLYIAPDGHTVSMPLDQTADHMILALTIDPEGDLWAGARGGLYRLPGAVAGQPIEHVVVPNIPPDAKFSSLTVADGALWTSTVAGVSVLDHGVWHNFDKTSGLRDTGMRYLIARADGRMCGTYYEPIGFSCFRYHGGALSQFEHVGSDEGLTSGMIYLLGEDSQHRLWIGSGEGIDVVTDHGIDHIDQSDGLAGDDASAMAFLADRDGSLWFGATGGATHVFAQSYDGPPPAPQVSVLDARLGDRGFDSARTALEVPHDHNTLNLTFASNSMLDAKLIDYQSRLAPLETEWSASQQRRAHYPALPPGTYRFEVRARLRAGSWGPTTILAFTIGPAWWHTAWFLALSILAGALAIGAGFAWGMGRRTRQLNRRSYESFRAVIDLMPDLISVHRDGNLSYLNIAYRAFLGFEDASARLENNTLNDRVHPDDHALFAELALNGHWHGAPGSEVIELRIRGADARARTCEVSGLQVDIGGAATVIISGRDVTERKRRRAKMLVDDRMASLGTLAAGIAHEINNPLSYVAGNLEVVADTLTAETSTCHSDPAARAEMVAAIADARGGGERVRKIVQGLSLFTRSEHAPRAVVVLPEVIEAAIRLTANELRHRAELLRQLGPVPQVVADEARLTQAIINLLINAAQAIPAGRSNANRITVRTRTDDQARAVIEIEDTGKGIPAEIQARVFDPFFTTKDVGEGTGLGLSICHGIITALGGQISIEAAVPHGALVRLVLPAAPAVPVAAVVPTIASVAGVDPPRRYRVLLVDDEPLVAQTIERLLRRDYDITIAQYGREAVDLINDGHWFDAIVSDVMMPNMSGVELIDELRRIAPPQADRLVFLSGGAFTTQLRERLDELGVQQLEKPVTAR
jgi:PAS domain S-box-containing protein